MEQNTYVIDRYLWFVCKRKTTANNANNNTIGIYVKYHAGFTLSWKTLVETFGEM